MPLTRRPNRSADENARIHLGRRARNLCGGDRIDVHGQAAIHRSRMGPHREAWRMHVDHARRLGITGAAARGAARPRGRPHLVRDRPAQRQGARDRGRARGRARIHRSQGQGVPIDYGMCPNQG